MALRCHNKEDDDDDDNERDVNMIMIVLISHAQLLTAYSCGRMAPFNNR